MGLDEGRAGSYHSCHAATSEPETILAEVTAMTWETPTFVEVKMDAEINSYQDDFDREQDDRF